MPTTLTRPVVNELAKVSKKRLTLSGGAKTTLHIAQYNKKKFRPRVVVIEPAARLLDWCKKNEFTDGISGGFFDRTLQEPLGELWIDGKRQRTAPFKDILNLSRACLHSDFDGAVRLAPFYRLPLHKSGDILQAGPLLVKKGKSVIRNGRDKEGFSRGADQFDSDITVGRYPRAAIALNDEYLFTVVCDGRAKGEAGLTLAELADSLIDLGAEYALNLDGGSSASLVASGKLRNKPRSNTHMYKRGRAIHTAIVFESI